jgi:MSHA biogenesis protein MshG
MGTFAYRAKATNGELIQGTMEADGEAAVTTRLQAMGYFPLQIRDETRAKAGGAAETIKSLTSRRIRTADITTLNRQLSDLISSGIPLV